MNDEATNQYQPLIDAFHRLYYHTLAWDKNQYLGYKIRQNPFDMQVYQELIFQLQPAFILQTGIAGGGSLLYFAHLLDAMNAPPNVPVIGIDITLLPKARTLNHPRIRMIEGSSTDANVLTQIRSLLPCPRGGLVSLDADHNQAHVESELALYHDFVDVNGYLVVEDTNINGHPVLEGWGPGPFEATAAFLNTHPQFMVDNSVWQRHFFSHHHWLKRIR